MPAFPVEQPDKLLPWLIAKLAPMSRTRVKELLGSGRVLVNGLPITQFDFELKPGDRVEIDFKPVRSPPFPILFEDDSLLAIDKPAGLLTVATEREKRATAFARLAEYLTEIRGGRAFVVHRLDRETSGVLLFAKTADARDRLQKHWGRFTKTYHAIVCGKPANAEGTIDTCLTETKSLKMRITDPGPNAMRAITHYRVLRTGGEFSVVEVGLETGRKHQIRVHLASLGCPVIGDDLYDAPKNPAKRLGLHAVRLQFEHPRMGQPVSIESPLPTALRKLVGEGDRDG